MASSDDMLRAQEENNRLLGQLIDLMRESTSGAGTLTAASQFGGAGSQLPPNANDGGGSSAGGSSSGGNGGGSGGGGGSDSRIDSLRRQALSQGAQFVASAADPLTPTASAGLSTAENLLAIVAGAVAGDKGAEAAQALAQGAFNAAGGREARFTLDNTLQDVQSTIESLSAQGLTLSDAQLDEITRSSKDFNEFRFEQLSRGAQSIDRVFGGALTGQQAADEERNRLLKQIADNTGKNPSRPDSALRGGE